jgi:hypothetical protein
VLERQKDFAILYSAWFATHFSKHIELNLEKKATRRIHCKPLLKDDKKNSSRTAGPTCFMRYTYKPPQDKMSGYKTYQKQNVPNITDSKYRRIQASKHSKYKISQLQNDENLNMSPATKRPIYIMPQLQKSHIQNIPNTKVLNRQKSHNSECPNYKTFQTLKHPKQHE